MKIIRTLFLVLAMSGSLFANPAKIHRSKTQGISGEFIVALNDNIPPDAVEGIARSLTASYNLTLHEVWPDSLRGFFCTGDDIAADALSDDPRVKYVEQNTWMELDASRVSAMQWTIFNGEYLWHLDRLDELSWANHDMQYNMCTEGRGAYAYMIDTGVERNHPQFETPSRVLRSLDFSADGGYAGTNDVTNGCTTGTNTTIPDNWHGTATASVVGGTQVGAAKVQIIELKVLRCIDQLIETRSLIAAVNWVNSTSNPYRTYPGVMNHSGFIAPWDSTPAPYTASAYGDTVASVVRASNIPFFTSADNFSADACRFSPKDRAYTKYTKTGRTVFVVGGTSVGAIANDPKDYRYQKWETVNGSVMAALGQDSGSNGGACVSIYAPAVSIYAARTRIYKDIGENLKLYDRGDGTSFSSPLVAAIAARWMQKYRAQNGVNPTYTQVYEWLLSQAQTPIYNVATPAYYYCAKYFNPATTYRPGTQPASCPSGTIGTSGRVTPTNPFSPPFYFPSVGNSSDARMVFYDEANGGTCP